MGLMMGNYDRNDREADPRGERVAVYVENYMAEHPGLSLGELAFRIKADKRDLFRLVNDRSCGWRLEDKLAAYFGTDLVDAIFRPIVGDGRSQREIQLEQELAAVSARREALERDRQSRRGPANAPEAVVRLGALEGGSADV